MLNTGTLRRKFSLFKVNFRNQNMMCKLFHIRLCIILQEYLFKKIFPKSTFTNYIRNSYFNDMNALILILSLRIASKCTAPAAHATPRKRKHHSPTPTPEEDDDNGPVQFDDTATVHDNIDDVVGKGDALSTSHLWSDSIFCPLVLS